MTRPAQTCVAQITSLIRQISLPNRKTDELSVIASVNHKSTALIRQVRVSWDGAYLALGDNSGIVRVLEFSTFKLLRTFRGHKKRIRDIDFGPDNNLLITTSEDGFIRFWQIKENKELIDQAIKVPRGIVPYAGRYNPYNKKQRYMLVGDASGRLLAWELVSRRRITNRTFHNGPINAVGYQPNGAGTLFFCKQ